MKAVPPGGKHGSLWRRGVGTFAVLIALAGCAAETPMRGPAAGTSNELARVVVPYEVEVLSIDDEAVQSVSLLRFRERRDLLLNPGAHRLVVRVRPTYDLADEDHRVVLSDAQVIEFEAAPDGRYRLAYRMPSRETPHAHATPGPAVWIEELPDDL